MREITEIKEIQSIELSILKYIDNICRTHGITYFMVGGTLLGAVRHQGFIPWDDDVDIAMPREDYQRFIRIMNEKKDCHYRFLNFQDVKEYYYPFGKVIDLNTKLIEKGAIPIAQMGVYVDVFPIDKIPSDDRIKKIWMARLKKCRRSWYLSYMQRCPAANSIKYILKWPFWKFCTAIGPYSYTKKIDSLCQLYAGCITQEQGVWAGGYFERENLPESVYSNTTELTFEDGKFLAPLEYELYLSRIYGDYMKLPPPSEREPKHGFQAWVLD